MRQSTTSTVEHRHSIVGGWEQKVFTVLHSRGGLGRNFKYGQTDKIVTLVEFCYTFSKFYCTMSHFFPPSLPLATPSSYLLPPASHGFFFFLFLLLRVVLSPPPPLFSSILEHVWMRRASKRQQGVQTKRPACSRSTTVKPRYS